MRTWKVLALGTLVAGGGSLGACGGATDEPREVADSGVGTRSQAIVNGADDVDTPEANVVVRLQTAAGGPAVKTCTGTLITPTLVLTANHCVNGVVGCGDASSGPPYAVAGGYPVQVGPDSAAFRVLQADAATPALAFASVVQTWSQPGGPTDCEESGGIFPNNDDYDTDLALVQVYPPILNDAAGALLAAPRRPTLGPISAGSTIKFAGWGRDNSGQATSVRKVGGPFYFSGNLDSDGNGDIRLRLMIEGVPRGPRPGDSGGPLFVLRPDGQFDQVGVLYGGFDELPIWTNLTNDDNNLWLSSVAADPSRPGKYHGESDYIGPCDTVRDPDCDHRDDAPICTIGDNGRAVCRVNDNCPGVYNPAQLESPSTNGDGFADGFLVDGDGDGVPDYCDLEPQCSYLLKAAGMDYDGDGLCGPFDALCPNDAANDADGDGVCDAVDNCVGVANPLQRNCNEEAERATKSKVLGDACDPVPCPAFRVATNSTVECSGTSNCGTVTRIPPYVFIDNVVVDPVGSSNVVTGGNERVVPATTAHRYCIEGVYPRPDGTFGQTRCFDDDAVSDALALTPLALEDATTRFHRVRVSGQPNAQSSTPALNYLSSDPPTSYRWDHTPDFASWRGSTWGSTWIRDPYDQSPIVRTSQSGRYWLHANTPVGQGVDLGGNGVHTKLDGSQGESLANHYQRAYPVVVTPHISAPLTCAGGGCFIPFDPCVGAGCYEPDPCIGGNCEGPCLTCELGSLADFDRFETRVLGAVQGGDLGFLTRAGGIARVQPRAVSPGTRALLATADRTLVRAVEPNRNIGQGPTLAQALVLDVSSFRVVDRLDVRGGSMFTRSEIRGAAEGGSRLLAPAVPPAPPAALAGRTAASIIYSSAIGRAFVIGGRDASGKSLGDVWTLSLDEGNEAWSSLPLVGAGLGTVIAATYAYADNHVWVLDEARGSWGIKVARLLRIDATTGESTVVGAWPRLGIFDKHWLGLDLDGSILLSASSSKAAGLHTIVRVATGTPKVTGVLVGLRALVAAPMVDRGGYTLVGPKRAGSAAAFDVRRMEKLGMSPGGWAQLGSCL